MFAHDHLLVRLLVSLVRTTQNHVNESSFESDVAAAGSANTLEDDGSVLGQTVEDTVV